MYIYQVLPENLFFLGRGTQIVTQTWEKAVSIISKSRADRAVPVA